MKKVKLGIIGVGNIGTTHVKNITEGRCPELEITAVADRREERREWARGVLPAGAAVFEEGEALLQSGLCEAVLIAVPLSPLTPWRAASTSCAKSLPGCTPRLWRR